MFTVERECSHNWEREGKSTERCTWCSELRETVKYEFEIYVYHTDVGTYRVKHRKFQPAKLPVPDDLPAPVQFGSGSWI